MTLDFEGKVPLYRQLAAILRDQITSGLIPAGRRLPGKKTIQQEYGVSQLTAEHALRMLKDEGLIETSLGRGMYVTQPEDRPQR